MSDSKTKSAFKSARVFKTDWFAKAAKKAGIDDEQLCKAFGQILLDQVDDLGGGVFKKRLNRNLHRSILCGKSKTIWVFVYLYAKSDRKNIEDDELKGFRQLADLISSKSNGDLQKDLDSGVLVEICT
ncbi:MAG TPA: type II toxin-antitoxin system RelE/ParE family toxin [Planktothrix sp.]|jgi:hypothetical protein